MVALLNLVDFSPVAEGDYLTDGVSWIRGGHRPLTCPVFQL